MDYRQKFEPKGNKIIHGAGQSKEMFRAYSKAVEKYKPIIYMTYMTYIKIQNLDKWLKNIKIELKDYPDVILQIGFNLRVNGKDATKEISKGKYDSELNKFLDFVTDFNRPIFIRLGYEFDAPGKYKPDLFVKSWKYFIDLSRSRGIKNLAFVWCACPYPGTEPIKKYYPGDDYVDWFGIDLFAVKNFENENSLVESFMNLAKFHRKPVMIGESTPARTGVNRGKASWDEWFKTYFNWISTHPNVKAFCYINWDWGKDWKQPEWLNGRIHENETVRKNFVKELSKKKYIHRQTTRSFLNLVYP